MWKHYKIDEIFNVLYVGIKNRLKLFNWNELEQASGRFIFLSVYLRV